MAITISPREAEIMLDAPHIDWVAALEDYEAADLPSPDEERRQQEKFQDMTRRGVRQEPGQGGQ